ncbi:MAG: transposase [Gammaproteobacteria bacterium]|nr:transposase [Gammaproteobacteria bacterium]
MATERSGGLLRRLATCFTDYRNPNSVEHDAHALVAQRVFGFALGYEKLNDHDALRSDSVLALLVGKRDLSGEDRDRTRTPWSCERRARLRCWRAPGSTLPSQGNR